MNQAHKRMITLSLFYFPQRPGDTNPRGLDHGEESGARPPGVRGRRAHQAPAVRDAVALPRYRPAEAREAPRSQRRGEAGLPRGCR